MARLRASGYHWTFAKMENDFLRRKENCFSRQKQVEETFFCEKLNQVEKIDNIGIQSVHLCFFLFENIHM